jgi:hypothetical protein
MEITHSTCKKCSHDITGNYCANCGYCATLKRIDSHYISHEVLHILHFEKGFFYTAKELLIRPGHSIREFIASDRSKHMKPIVFLIVTSLMYTIIANLFHADEIYSTEFQQLMGESTVNKIWHWIQTHYGYANIMMGTFLALGVRLLFRKYKYNLFEIIVLTLFVTGEGMLILTFVAFFTPFLHPSTYLVFLTLFSLIYPTWAIGQFFDKSKITNYLKAFFAYLIGSILFSIVVTLVGITIDLFSK